MVLSALASRAAAAKEEKGVGTKQWHYTVDVPRPPRRGKPQSPAVGHLWLAKDVKLVRGLIVAGKTSLEKRICLDPQIRRAAAEKGMGVLYFEPALDALFNYVQRKSGEKLEAALAKLASTSGHPELEFAPMLTVGHSTGGIYCRNVAFWKPHRVIGVIHVKSGNFQDGLWDKSRSIAGVPFLAINGEFEEFGPKGGDLGRGLRSQYSLHPSDKKKKNQTQWVMIRMQILDRRRKDPNNLMSLVIHRGRGHGGWDDDMSRLCALFIGGAADARIPPEPPDGKSEVRCRPLTAEDGWLSDADIKAPRFPPAPWGQYKGDRKLAFWHVSKAVAGAVAAYHAGKWEHPDPTAGQPIKKRYYPPPILQDVIDMPKPGKAGASTRPAEASNAPGDGEKAHRP
jgi:hypothetical protein